VNFDRSPSKATGQPSTAPANERKVQYLNAAPITDVLLDQLEYLIAHSRENCPEECTDCARLEHVSSWLLLPFRRIGR